MLHDKVMEIKFVITNSYYKYKTVIKIRNRVSFHMIRNNEGIKTKALFYESSYYFHFGLYQTIRMESRLNYIYYLNQKSVVPIFGQH